MRLAPIVLFVYNRSEHTRNTLESLEKNFLSSESLLYIYSDGAKSDKDSLQVEKVRNCIREKKWCGEVIIYESDSNLGLAKSISKGVTEIVNKHEKIIVIEDDLNLDKHFLQFMNESLDRYKDTEKVMQVSGYLFPANIQSESAFFLPLTTSWGWGTWKRAWKSFESNTAISSLRNSALQRYKFNFYNSYDYYSMLENKITGKINSWAIDWYYNVFQLNGLILYPSKSLVQNNGFDNSGVNCPETDIYSVELPDSYTIQFPAKIKIDTQNIKKIKEYFLKVENRKNSLRQLFLNFLFRLRVGF